MKYDNSLFIPIWATAFSRIQNRSIKDCHKYNYTPNYSPSGHYFSQEKIWVRSVFREPIGVRWTVFDCNGQLRDANLSRIIAPLSMMAQHYLIANIR